MKTIIIPTFLLSYLVNGDNTGITEREKEAANKFMADNNISAVSPQSEPFYSGTNDIGYFGGCECVECSFA